MLKKSTVLYRGLLVDKKGVWIPIKTHWCKDRVEATIRAVRLLAGYIRRGRVEMKDRIEIGVEEK